MLVVVYRMLAKDHESMGSGSGPGAYLVVLRDVVVGHDLAGAIRSHTPDAVVMVAQSVEAAMTQLQHVTGLTMAFIGVAPSLHAGSDLAVAIAARGGRTVFIGDEAEDRSEELGITVLMRPFDTEAILRFLGPRGAR